MIQQYGGSCMSERKVYQWVERFQEGRTSVTDANIAHMDELIGENRQISVDTITTMLNISIGSPHGIIHETLKCCFVPGGCQDS
jgi:hypothetical protein